MTCEKYQSLPPDERSPEDQLLIELAKVSYIHMLSRNEVKLTYSSPNNGADALGARQLLNETRVATI